MRITYQRAGKTIVETWEGTPSVPPRPIDWADAPPPRFKVVVDKTVVEFPEVEVGAAGTWAVALKNEGNTSVFPTFNVEGDAFALGSSSCATLVAGASCAAFVVFRPVSSALVTGKLTITPAPAPPLTVTFSGRGIYRDAGPEPPDAEAPDTEPD